MHPFLCISMIKTLPMYFYSKTLSNAFLLFGLVGFYGISTIEGYLIPSLPYTYYICFVNYSLEITFSNESEFICLHTNAFLQTHLPKPNPCCIVWSRHQETLASTWILTKWSTCVLMVEISRQVHITRQQHLIYWKWCQYSLSKGIDYY